MKVQRAARTFGPFWGEFGWEIAQWAPWVNARSDSQQGDRILCQPGHAALYAFDGPISQSYPRPPLRVPDMLQPWPRSLDQMPKLTNVKGVPCINGDIKPIPLYPHCSAQRRFIVLHCRNIPKCPERNYGSWDYVVEELNKEGVQPVVVGSHDDRLPKGDVLDLRGASLDDTISYMRTALVVVGASSGPMHLAQACEAPVVVWSGNYNKDRMRYTSVWNHFDSPTRFIHETWQPPIAHVLKAIEASV